MSFMQRSAKHFLLIKAARQFRQEIEKAGLDNLKILAENGISIVKTYLDGCSPSEKATYKRDLNTLLQMGVTSEMLLTEIARQMPEVSLIMKGKERYREAELQNITEFLRGD